MRQGRVVGVIWTELSAFWVLAGATVYRPDGAIVPTYVAALLVRADK